MQSAPGVRYQALLPILAVIIETCLDEIVKEGLVELVLGLRPEARNSVPSQVHCPRLSVDQAVQKGFSAGQRPTPAKLGHFSRLHKSHLEATYDTALWSPPFWAET